MKRILFVEDDPVVVGVYRDRLEREGFSIEVAEDGLVAMRSLATTKPDLVILDLMLPKVNGLEILKYIRGNPRLGAIPVIVLSNAYLPDMVKQAMLAGANKPLFKSQCTPSALLKVVRSFLPESGGNGDEAVRTIKGDTNQDLSREVAQGSIRGDEGLELNLLLKARSEFLETAPTEMTHIRELCVGYVKNAGSAAGVALLENLYQRVHFICARAGLIGLSRIAMLAGAFEAVLFEIVLRPASATQSLFHTIAQATDCLRRLIGHAETDSLETGLDAKVLVIDDDGVCNHIMVQALRRVNLAAVGVKDPIEAIRLLQNERFDLVLLDIMMPGMDGFDVCKKLRGMSHQRATPVIFVTANAEFENRVKSILAGGNELIAKPISPMELALKAITVLLDAKIPPAGPGSSSAEATAMPNASESHRVAHQTGLQESLGSGTEPITDRAFASEEVRIQPQRPLHQVSESFGEPNSAQDIREATPFARSTPPTAGEPEYAEVTAEQMTDQVSAIEESYPADQASPSGHAQAQLGPEQAGTEQASPKSPSNEQAVSQPGWQTIEFNAGASMPSARPAELETLGPLPATVPQAPPGRIQTQTSGPDETTPGPQCGDVGLELIKTASEQDSVAPVRSSPPESETGGFITHVRAPDETAPAVTDASIRLVQNEPIDSSDLTEAAGGTSPPEPGRESAFEQLLLEQHTVEQAAVETVLTLNNELTPMQKEQAQVLDRIAIAVARIIFGEEKLTELNVRLVRIALERYNIPEIIGMAESPKPA